MDNELLNDFSDLNASTNSGGIPHCVECGCVTTHTIQLNPAYHPDPTSMCEECDADRLDRTGYDEDGDFDGAYEYDREADDWCCDW